MSNRNFILLTVVLIILTIFGIGYFSSYRSGPATDEGEGTNFLSQFNPFGSDSQPKPPINNNEPIVYDPDPEIKGDEVVLKLNKVSSMPVAGYGVFKKERLKEVKVETASVATSTSTTVKKPSPPTTELVSAVRYVARANGNIYQTFADKLDERKFTSTVIPKVYEAFFGNKGQSVIMRYLKADEITIDTFVGSMPKEVLGADTNTNEVKGVFLPENIKDVSMSPDYLKLFYLDTSGENILGMTHGLVDNKKAQVFDSPFSEWLSLWPNSKMLTLTTKPSAKVAGYMYAVDPAVKKLYRVLGDIAGLTTLTSPSSKLVLYSGNDLALNLYDISTKTSRAVGLRTMPEKCVWNKLSVVVYCAVPREVVGALYPDAWYKGAVSFSDQIWKIDIATGATEIMADPITVIKGEEIDGIKLGLDEDEKYLFFLNKKDSYLWKLDLI